MKKFLMLSLCITKIVCAADTETLVPINFKSSAFANESPIPLKYTCDGQSISPPFSISNVPNNAKSLMLIAVDREASRPPDQVVVWFLYNIPPETKIIPENQIPNKTLIGRNTDGSITYQGPCPKDVGNHRYYFSLYALDIVLPDNITSLSESSGLTENHLIGYANWMGTYTKKDI